MATNRRFILLIFGVKLSDVRAALNTGACPSTSTPLHIQKNTPRVAPTANALIDYANYSKLPQTYATQDQFPKNTNLLCWHCSLPFAGQPRFIPIESIRAPKRVEPSGI
jgi:hypothetical protein